MLIIRHGQSMFNAGLIDNYDSSLTNLGNQQIQDLCTKLLNINLENYSFYVSPFLRCLETAKIINYSLPFAKFIVNSDISEYSLDWLVDFVNVPNRKKDFPEFIWTNQPESYTFLKETNDDYIKRINSINLLPNSLLVSHGMTSYMLYNRLSGVNLTKVPQWSHQVRNGELLVI